MYDKSRDQVLFSNNSDKNYFDIKSEEILCWYNQEEDLWIYEYINNNSFDLSFFNTGFGTIYKTSFTKKTTGYEVEEHLFNRFPDANICLYERMEDWVEDHVAGCSL